MKKPAHKELLPSRITMLAGITQVTDNYHTGLVAIDKIDTNAVKVTGGRYG
jgi:hypothetical protein